MQWLAAVLVLPLLLARFVPADTTPTDFRGGRLPTRIIAGCRVSLSLPSQGPGLSEDALWAWADFLRCDDVEDDITLEVRRLSGPGSNRDLFMITRRDLTCGSRGCTFWIATTHEGRIVTWLEDFGVDAEVLGEWKGQPLLLNAMAFGPELLTELHVLTRTGFRSVATEYVGTSIHLIRERTAWLMRTCGNLATDACSRRVVREAIPYRWRVSGDAESRPASIELKPLGIELRHEGTIQVALYSDDTEEYDKCPRMDGAVAWRLRDTPWTTRPADAPALNRHLATLGDRPPAGCPRRVRALGWRAGWVEAVTAAEDGTLSRTRWLLDRDAPYACGNETLPVRMP